MRRVNGVGVLCTLVFSWSLALEAAGPIDPPVQREEGLAAHYLPVYDSGAAYAGFSDDRREDARNELELWKEMERREIAKNRASGRRTGERDVNERLNLLRKDLRLSEDEFAGLLERTDTELARISKARRLETGKPGVSKPFIQPIYTELAYLCAAPGSVAFYSAEQGDDQPALAQYENATRVNDSGLRGGIVSAWELDVGEGAHGYAWLDSQSPEVLIVAVSTAHTCDLAEITDQVGIERFE